MAPSLLSPVRLGVYDLPNRIVATSGAALAIPPATPGLIIVDDARKEAAEIVRAAGGRVFAPLRSDEPGATVEAFRATARFARDAGFDGVEIQAAHGWVDRADLRRLKEVLVAVCAIAGPERTGVRIAPTDANCLTALWTALGGRALAYLHGAAASDALPWAAAREAFGGPLILAGRFDRDGGQAALDDGQADLIAFDA